MCRIHRRMLRKARRENLERLARSLGLRFESWWSQKHLAALVYWRLTRSERSRH